MFLLLIIPLPLSLILMLSGTDFQILLRYHKISNKGKRKVLTILSARLDSRQKMTAIKEKMHHPLNCCRLLSMMTRGTYCSHRLMKDDARITRRGMAHISPQVSHDVISPFPLFRLLRSRQASYPGAATSISRSFFRRSKQEVPVSDGFASPTASYWHS